MKYDDREQAVEIGFLARLWHRLWRPFSTTRRQMTEAEVDLRDEVIELKREVETLLLTVKQLEKDVDERDARLRVQEVEITGMAAIIARHEKHWEAEQAILSAKVATAERYAAQAVNEQLQ